MQNGGVGNWQFGDIIVGIDVGTSKVCTVVGRVNNFNQIEIICSTQSTCNGIKKTKIVDKESICSAIQKNIEDINKLYNLQVNSAYINVPGKYVQIVQNKAMVNAIDPYARNIYYGCRKCNNGSKRY